MTSDIQAQLKTLWAMKVGEVATLPPPILFLNKEEPTFAQCSLRSTTSATYELHWYDLRYATVKIEKRGDTLIPVETDV